MEKLQEAEKLAKAYCEKAHPQTPKEAVYVAGFLTGTEHSKEVIEELVKALEEARATFRVLGLHQEANKYNELIQKHRNNEIIRLKSLNNISNNNGWNRIDEVGLPKEEGAYVIIDFSTGEALNYLEVNNMHAVRIYHHDSGHTHYRKKEVYPDPIY